MARELVLLNGWGMTSAVWRALMGAFEGRRVTCFDVPDAVGGDGALDAAAEDVARRAPQRCDVVGWSLGAQVALQWALKHPGQVARLATIAATPCFVQRPDWPAAMDAETFEDFQALFEAQPAAALARFALLQARGEKDAARIARTLRAATCATKPGELTALTAGLRLLRSTDLRAAVRHARQPVYLVHGAADALVPAAAAEWLHRALPDARLEIVPGAGHAPHVSQPAAVTARLAEYFHDG